MADFDNSLPLGGLAGLGDALLRAVERELVFRGEALPRRPSLPFGPS